MLVYLLTENQKDLLLGKKYTDNTFFYPIQDSNNNWVISQQEVDYCTNEEFLWVKDLTAIPYSPKQYEI